MFLTGMVIVSPVRAQDSGPTVASGQVSNGTIKLDGLLNEPAWERAGRLELSQQSPDPGKPTAFRTTVLFLHDSHTLYIGFICHDPQPSKIVTTTLMRDASQTSDDNVTIVLDPFDTQRTAYVFQVNAAGAMADGLIAPTPTSTSTYSGVDYSWNGTWKAKVHRNAHGWTAEIAIDTRTLQFKKNSSAWGLNIGRYVPRDLLTLMWSGINLNASVTNLQWEGTLTGMQGLQRGKALDFRPYGLVKNGTNTGTTTKAGFDLKYRFTPSIAGLFTYNTDFSEAEPDQEKINTTRFALSFPETRHFFLQGSNLFSFGYDLAGNAGTTFIPYQSRDVGLVNGITVPLDEGVKIFGQSQSGTLGLLDVQMGGSTVSAPTNLFVGRGAYSASRDLQVGALVTHGTPTGQGTNTFVGSDAVWHTSNFGGDKNLDLFGWAARSSGDLPSGSPYGYGAGLDYPNDLWLIRANINVYGSGLDPALGFLPRPGTKQYYLELDYKPRPKSPALNWIQQFFWHGDYTEVDGINGGKQSSQWFFFPNMNTNSGYYYELDFYQEYDAPPQPFEIAPSVEIPTGQYQWNYYGFKFNTPKFDPLVLSAFAYSGGYYGGHMNNEQLQLNWNLPPGRLQLTASQELFSGQLPQGDFYERLSIFGATYSFAPDLYITTLAQHASEIPGLSLYAQMHWIINSASNIYLIWNHGLVTETNGLGTPVIAPGSNMILKVQWDFR